MAKHEHTEGLYPVDKLKGQFVKRVTPCPYKRWGCVDGKMDVYGAPYNGDTCQHCEGKGYLNVQAKVYIVECWRGDLKRWQLCDWTDTMRCVYVKPGTKLFAGFTY